MPEIEIKGVGKKFEGKRILNDISLEISEKEILGIIGQSGAGKTVLLKILIGFYKPEEGTITYGTKNLFRNLKEIQKKVGFASQRHSIYPDLSVKENLRYFGRLYGLKRKEIRESINHVLELVELSDFKDKLAMRLSGGMRRRLDIACALIHKPKILILDEPVSGLDPVLRKHMAELIQKIRKEGTTIIFSSHFMNEMVPLCDKIAILKKGNLIAFGTPLQIQKKFSDVYELILHTYPGNYNKIAKALVASKLQVINWGMVNNRFMIKVPRTKTAKYYLQFFLDLLEKNKESLLDIQLNQLSIEEVFARIIV